eukprot:544237_1
MHFVTDFAWFIFLLQITASSNVATNNCDHPLQDYKFGGSNLGWKAHLLTETKPVIFPCTYDSGGAKWVRFRVTKQEGPLDKNDEIIMLMSSGMNCGEGYQINPNDINAESILCDLKKHDVSCPAQNIRVSDTLSDPFVQTVCVIAYCRNENNACNAEIQVEFYDQFAQPSEISRPLFGMTWLDLLAWIVGLVMSSMTIGIFYGLFGKYYDMFKERRDIKKKKEKKLREKKRKEKMKNNIKNDLKKKKKKNKFNKIKPPRAPVPIIPIHS